MVDYVKYRYLGLLLASLVGYAVVSQAGKGFAMDIDQFQWGEPACDGLAVGIAVEKNVPNKPIVYHFALANRSPSTRRITLFSMVPGLFRLRIIGRHGAVKESAPALDLPISNPQVQISETLAHGQMLQRRGHPTTFRGQLTGKGTLHIILSLFNSPNLSPNLNEPVPEDSDQWCHIQSAEVEVEFYPMGKD